MSPTIFLFDIDGTLINAGGAGRRAIERAFRAHVGRDDVFDGLTFQGLTDRLIVRTGLERVGRAFEPTVVEAILTTYLEALADEVPRAAAYAVYPGVEAVLTALGAWTDAAVGLGTGNLRRGAELKLARAKLEPHFRFGGYGCDHEDRAELLRVGAARGAAVLGVVAGSCRVVVIGDTVRDVQAANAIGAECVAVCTSGCDAGALRAAGAVHAFDRLDAPGVLDALAGQEVACAGSSSGS